MRFSERADLLKHRIFGGDINFMACRVTAFSLYLSLLEGLESCGYNGSPGARKRPIAIAKRHKPYPRRRLAGDFFCEDDHAFADKRFSLISIEPTMGRASRNGANIGGRLGRKSKCPDCSPPNRWRLFALRAIEFLETGGKVCLILPIGQFLATIKRPLMSPTYVAALPTFTSYQFRRFTGTSFPDHGEYVPRFSR